MRRNLGRAAGDCQPVYAALDIPRTFRVNTRLHLSCKPRIMKIKNSLKTLKSRHKACRIVKRKGRVYIINKENPRFKARQR